MDPISGRVIPLSRWEVLKWFGVILISALANSNQMAKGAIGSFLKFKPESARLERRALSRCTAVNNPAIGLSGGDRMAVADDKQPYVHSAAVANASGVTYIGSLFFPKTLSLPLQGVPITGVTPVLLGSKRDSVLKQSPFSRISFATVLVDLLGHFPDAQRLTCRILLNDILPQRLNFVCSTTNAAL